MDLTTIYQVALPGLGALIYIFYQQKILQSNLLLQIFMMIIKIGINIIVAAILILIFYGLESIDWAIVFKSALIMQTFCAGPQIAWKIYKK